MDGLRAVSMAWVVVLAVVENVAVLLVGLVAGRALRGGTASTRATGREVRAAAGAVAVNAVVTVVGVALWRSGWITFAEPGLRSVVDLAVFVVVSDLALWAGHSAAHVRGVYELTHRFHHRTLDPGPLTLFVLHPVETISFGALWLAYLTVVETTVPALVLYAALNLAFGVLAHAGREVLPVTLRRSALFRWVATPTLHLQHHHDPAVNRGFYTTVWDRAFGTLHPDYDAIRTASGRDAGGAVAPQLP